MNIQVGKSVGFALLMAAGMLAILFAFGVFAPVGVDAGVKGGANPPKVTLDKSEPEDEDVTMTITFEVNDDVDDAPANDSVGIVIPNGTAASEFTLATGFSASNVTVMQDGVSVGKVAVDATDGDDRIIVINPADSGGRNLAKDKTVTVTVTGLTNPTDAARVAINVGQQDSPTDAAFLDYDSDPDVANAQSAYVSVFDPEDAVSGLSAALDNDEAGAEDVTLTIKFTSSSTNDVTITLPTEYDVMDGNTAATGITIAATGGSTATPVDGDDDGDTIAVTPGAADAEVVVTIGADLTQDPPTGGFTNPDASATYEVGFAQGVYPDATTSFSVIKPAPADLSTDKAGADVVVTITANAGAPVRGGRDISVTLPGFGIPDIDEDDVIIYSDDYDGNPASISVDGSEITLTVPLRTSKGQNAGQTKTTSISGTYTILFKSSAGLTNPTSAKDVDITVSDADPEDEESTVTIVKTASVKPTFVARGDDATVTAKGLRDGITTVYLLDDDGDRGDSLGTATADDGVVEIPIGHQRPCRWRNYRRWRQR